MLRLLPPSVATLLLLLLCPAAGWAASLEEIRDRGLLLCGLVDPVEGLAVQEDSTWRGFDSDLCRAFAAALLGSPEAVRYVPASDLAHATELLRSGKVDVLARAEPTGSRLRSVATVLLSGVGWLHRNADGLDSPATLAGRLGCAGEEDLPLLSNQAFRFEVRPFQDLAAGGKSFLEGHCDFLLGDLLALAAWRRAQETAAHLVFGRGQLTLQAGGPVIPSDAESLGERLAFVIALLFEAEALGVTQSMSAGEVPLPEDPRATRLLEEDWAEGALPPGWAARVIAAVGNYAEMFGRNLGAGSRLGLPRGANSPPEKGGLLRPLPLR